MSRILSVLIAAAIAALPAQAEISEDSARAPFEAAQRICSLDNDALWGVSLCGNIVVVDRETRAAIANAPMPNAGFTGDDGVFVGSLPAAIAIANTAFDWEGERWVQLVAPLPGDINELPILVAHESFHRIQPLLGIEQREGANGHLDSEIGRLLARLEARALAAALDAEDEGWRDHAQAAIAFQRRRMRAFPEHSADETALLLNEGLAEYTGIRLGAPDNAAAFAIDRLDGADHRDTLVRTFGYIVGPAYGLLLDRSGAEWRSDAAAGASLPLLLEASLASEGAIAGAESYGYAEIVEEERARAARIATIMAQLRARFFEGPVLNLPFSQMNIAFDPNAVVALDDLGNVYTGATITDVWGQLTADEDVLVAASWSSATVPLERPGIAAGPGWSLTLGDGWHAVPGEREGDLVIVRRD